MVNKVIQRNIRISHRKAQLVCDLIRNQPVAKAIVILKSTNKKIAPIILKLLNSAIANATNNHAMNAEKLYIYNIFANQGPTMKRTMPRARGSADMIRKRSTHIEIHLSDNPDERKLALAKKSKKTKPNKKPKVQAKPEPKKVEPKPESKPKKPKASDIPVDKKHEVVSMKEFEDYDYEEFGSDIEAYIEYVTMGIITPYDYAYMFATTGFTDRIFDEFNDGIYPGSSYMFFAVGLDMDNSEKTVSFYEPQFYGDMVTTPDEWKRYGVLLKCNSNW